MVSPRQIYSSWHIPFAAVHTTSCCKSFLQSFFTGALEQGHALCLDDSISVGGFMSSNSAIEPREVEFAQCLGRAFKHQTIAEIYKAIAFGPTQEQTVAGSTEMQSRPNQ